MTPQQLNEACCTLDSFVQSTKIGIEGLDYLFLSLESTVNNLHELKRFWQNLKRSMAGKVLNLQKSDIYSSKTKNRFDCVLKTVNQVGTEF